VRSIDLVSMSVSVCLSVCLSAYLNKDQLSLTNPSDALRHGRRAVNNYAS